ncbi:H-type small acid-soluble spore protein [Caldibacillus lycopersici]|uniref:Small, acid-soluble spore protein H n=1 Tax=Perspicuibacillus lycopersici TaxID=1325689 RepID=A0AAE3ITN2_9BACI|nr:H-type small acid-soluble spore protein [Perspicuibacillus lycopersici]MCU9613398.1 H-type small acid-soluble spore protein [Perspicuibacillus lycopersici]
MNRLRAEEIASSAAMHNVTYNGKRIFIQQVNNQSETARIYYLDEPQNEFEVQLVNLREH